MVHYIKRSVEPRHALKIDGAVKKPGPVKAAAEDRPVEPVLAVVYSPEGCIALAIADALAPLRVSRTAGGNEAKKPSRAPRTT